MANINENIENLQDELGALRSIASDIGKSLRDAFSSPDVTEFKKEVLSTLFTFNKIDKVLSDTSVSLDKVLRKEISRKDLAKEISKLSSLEYKIKADIAKVSAANNVTTQAEVDLKNELLDQLHQQLGIIQDQKIKVEDISKVYKGQNTIFDAAKKKLEGFNTTYLSTLSILTFIIKAGLKANEQTTQLGRTLGLSYENANNVRQEMVEYSRAAEDSFINTDRLVKAQTDLTEQLGFAVKFSNQELEIFARLTEITGLTAQEAGNIAKFSAAVGMTSKDYVSNLRVGAFYTQQSTKTHFSDKQILQDISKLSTGILIKFQSNPKALAQAVVQAKALGTSLEQVDKVGESLLNWESSIENELKAELITGRQINIEKARYAALTGDQVTLMNELANQVGSLADFQNMNIIAQKSLAEAFGMSREEMSEMLIKQEAINKYGSEASKLNKEQLEYMEKYNMSAAEMLEKVDNQRSAQEKFNDAMTKLQDIIGNLVAGPLGQLIDGFASIASNATVMKLAIGAMLGMSITRLITGLASLVIPLVTGAAASITMMSALTLGVGAVAILASIAGISSAMNSAKEEMSMPPETKFATGGIVTSEINNATIGEAGPEAIIPLNSSKANKILGSGITDLTPMILAINEVRNAINELKNRPSIAYINGKDAFASNLGTVSALGTSQIQNSYKLA